MASSPPPPPPPVPSSSTPDGGLCVSSSRRRLNKGVVVDVALSADQHELRDEFKCPITQQLLRDPVVAGDGHTYERSAIERWLVHKHISPKTGQPLEHKWIVPNLNLKRLVDDLICEGGRGLFSAGGGGTTTTEDRRVYRQREGRRASLVREPVLLLRCAGPAETDWNGRSFEVCRDGVVGGRRRPSVGEDSKDKDFMQFTDSTVSRRHFEISYSGEDETFSLKDLGSASGTFRRLRPHVSAFLDVGRMAMIGKHQLVVVASPSEDALTLRCFAPDGSPLQGKEFTIEKDGGATLGRRASNTISFSHDVDGEIMGIDSSVSSEHARIVYDDVARKFAIHDGNAHGRASTNGTWIRLDNHTLATRDNTLQTDDEILIGTIRFHVSITQGWRDSTQDDDDDEDDEVSCCGTESGGL